MISACRNAATTTTVHFNIVEAYTRVSFRWRDLNDETGGVFIQCGNSNGICFEKKVLNHISE